MNPHIDPTQGLHLPQPTTQPGQLPVHGGPVPAASAPGAPSPAFASPQPVPAPAAEASAHQPSQAAEALDEEWVAKAKEVVEQTSMDPYMQSKGLARVKAEYLKARYNKDVKISKD